MPDIDPVPPTVVPPELQQANQAANLSNAITGLFGISGSGKSALADTAVEYCYDEFGRLSLCYAMDPGGFGTKRLALIRAGILQVWDPSNHINAFETMELVSLGAWPEKIVDPERGFAEPDVKLILPRYLRYVLICPNGHQVAKYDKEIELNARAATPQPCPTCQHPTGLGNALRVDKEIMRHGMFKHVGLRIYDSITSMNERGMVIELPKASASGQLPTTAKGGSLLASADALKSGQITYGSGSEAQVGFMQNRTYQWLTNIRGIPDQVVPAICTFGVEVSKQDDESAGVLVLGPRISGKARTAAVPGWLGNCLNTENYSDDQGRMRFRLWLTNHVDPRDPRKIPYLSKTRGVPRGLPPFLEDPWDDDPAKRDANAWTVCSLGYLFRLLDKQAQDLTAELKAKYPDVPKVEGEEEVLSTVVARGGVGGGAAAVASANASGVTSTTPAVVAPAGRGIRRLAGHRPAVAPPPVVPAVAPATPAVAAPPVPTTPAVPAPPVSETVPRAAASLAGGAASGAATVAAPPVVPAQPAPQLHPSVQAEKPIATQLVEAAAATGVVTSQSATPAPATAPTPPPVTPPTPAPVATGARPLRRIPRPPSS